MDGKSAVTKHYLHQDLELTTPPFLTLYSQIIATRHHPSTFPREKTVDSENHIQFKV